MLRKRKVADMEHSQRLNRIVGQIEGVRKMIENGRYCVDIMIQIRAARAGLRALEYKVLEEHLKYLSEEAFSSKTAKQDKITELKALFDNFNS